MIATLILVATAITCPPHPQGAKASEVGISCPEQLALYEEMLNHENTFIRTQGWWHIEWLYEAWARPVGRNQPKCPTRSSAIWTNGVRSSAST